MVPRGLVPRASVHSLSPEYPATFSGGGDFVERITRNQIHYHENFKKDLAHPSNGG